MKHIIKNNSPKVFEEWKDKNPTLKYVDLKGKIKDDLKDSLLKEQKFLCCYCERIITKANCHIEHFKPKDAKQFPELQLVYSNLHASCIKIVDNLISNDDLHCGHKKGNEYNLDLISPLEEDCESHFYYTLDGRIHPNNNDVRAGESIRILNLDSELLNSSRRELIRYFEELSEEEKEDEIKSHLDSSKEELGEFYTMIESLHNSNLL